MDHSRRTFLGVGAAGLAGALSAQQTASSKKPLRVGLIGTGNRGSYLGGVVEKLGQQGEGVDLVAVCDIYQPRMEKAAAKLKAKGYNTSAEMYREEQLDAVVVATPDRSHIYNIAEAIRLGKDVYCEKPLCHWAQFDELKALVHENRKLNRVVQIGTQFVADSVWERAGQALKDGAIGKPVHAQTGYFRHGDSGEAGMPIDDPNAKDGQGVNWAAFEADAPKHPFDVSRMFRWRLYLDYSGGPVTDVYPHVLTPLLKTLQPGYPHRVVAVGGRHFYMGEREVPDTFDLLIEYPQGITVAVLGTFANEVGIDPVIRGSEATLTKRQMGITIEPQRNSTKQRMELAADIPAKNEGHNDLAIAHMKNFLDCVRTRHEPRGSLEFAYTVQIPLIMAMQSHLNNRTVFFDAETETIRFA